MRNGKCKDNNRAQQISLLVWQLITYGRLYNATTDKFDDPLDEKYDRFGEDYSKELLDFVSDNARVDAKQTHIRVGLIIEKIDTIISKLERQAKKAAQASSELPERSEEESEAVEEDSELDVADVADVAQAPPAPPEFSHVADEIFTVDTTDSDESGSEIHTWTLNGMLN